MSYPDPLMVLAAIAATLAVGGMVQSLVGWRAVRRFAKQPYAAAPSAYSVTVLKPLHGDEPLLEQALTSVCAQDYPTFQIVFGVQRSNDPAIAVVERLRLRFPKVDIALVVNPKQHGQNRKVGNLINMLPAAKHDVLVIADSDLHCAPDYLTRVVAALDDPNVGLVTTLYAGLASTRSWVASLGAMAINHGFLPGALMSRDLGRQDCLGATMALRRDVLEASGGLEALVGHLADDNVLGRNVRDLGLDIRIASTVPATTVPESKFGPLFRHELRWSRTILSLVPMEFALSSIQYPLAWSMFAWALSGSGWALLLCLASWAVRAAAAAGIDRILGLAAVGRASPVDIWLMPVRDFVSMAIILASYASDTVEWQGQMIHTNFTTPSDSDSAHGTKRVPAHQGTMSS